MKNSQQRSNDGLPSDEALLKFIAVGTEFFCSNSEPASGHSHRYHSRIDGKVICADVYHLRKSDDNSGNPFRSDAVIISLDFTVDPGKSSDESFSLLKFQICTFIQGLQVSPRRDSLLVIVAISHLPTGSDAATLGKWEDSVAQELQSMLVIIVPLEETDTSIDARFEDILYATSSMVKSCRDVANGGAKKSSTLFQSVRDRVLSQLKNHRKALAKLRVKRPMVLPSSTASTVEIYWEGDEFDSGELKYLYHVQSRSREHSLHGNPEKNSNDCPLNDWQDIAVRVGNRYFLPLVLDKLQNTITHEFRVRVTTQTVAGGVSTSTSTAASASFSTNSNAGIGASPEAITAASYGILWSEWSESLSVIISPSSLLTDSHNNSSSHDHTGRTFFHLLPASTLPRHSSSIALETASGICSASPYLYHGSQITRFRSGNNDWKPFWTPDAFCDSCEHCNQAFSVTNRRHHCRSCGQCICAQCLVTSTSSSTSGPRLCRPCKDVQSLQAGFKNARLAQSPPTFLACGFSEVMRMLLTEASNIVSVSLSPEIWYEGSKSILVQGLAVIKVADGTLEEKIIVIKQYKESYVELFSDGNDDESDGDEEDEESDECEEEENEDEGNGKSDNEDDLVDDKKPIHSEPEIVSPMTMEIMVHKLFSNANSGSMSTLNLLLDGTQSLHPFLVTEFSGHRLSDILSMADSQHCNVLPVAWRLSVVLEVVKALSLLHNNNIAHLDLHAGNILVSSFSNLAGTHQSHVKLTGFAAAKSFAAYTCEHMIDHFDAVLQVSVRLASCSSPSTSSYGAARNSHIPLEVMKSLKKEAKSLSKKNRTFGQKAKHLPGGIVLARPKLTIDAGYDIYSLGVLLKVLLGPCIHTTGADTGSLTFAEVVEKLIKDCCKENSRSRPSLNDIVKELENCLQLLVHGSDGVQSSSNDFANENKAFTSPRYQSVPVPADEEECDDQGVHPRRKVHGGYVDATGAGETDGDYSDPSNPDTAIPRYLVLARSRSSSNSAVSALVKILTNEAASIGYGPQSVLTLFNLDEADEITRRGWQCRRSQRSLGGDRRRRKCFSPFEWNTVYERHPHIPEEFIPMAEVGDVLLEDKVEEFRSAILPLVIRRSIDGEGSTVKLKCLKVDRQKLSATSPLKDISQASMTTHDPHYTADYGWIKDRFDMSLEVSSSSEGLVSPTTVRHEGRAKSYVHFKLEEVASYLHQLKEQRRLKQQDLSSNSTVKPIVVSFDLESYISLSALKSVQELNGWKVGCLVDDTANVSLEYELL